MGQSCLHVMRTNYSGALAVLGGGAFAYMAGPGLLIIGGWKESACGWAVLKHEGCFQYTDAGVDLGLIYKGLKKDEQTSLIYNLILLTTQMFWKVFKEDLSLILLIFP